MIAKPVQPSDPTLVLIFGHFDPSGASSLPADAVTCASLGCHALSALTATLVRDSANTEEVQPAAPDFLDDQARCLLEDMPVKAIKVGPVYTTETISVIAQIAADYSDIPLLIQPAPIPYESLADGIDAEDAQLALFELLLPQSDIVVVHSNLLAYWQAQSLLSEQTHERAEQALLAHGAGCVLSWATSLRQGHRAHVLFGPNGQTRSWSDDVPARAVLDSEGPAACAIIAQLAQGRKVVDAVEHALESLDTLTAGPFQPGMGQLLLNRSKT